MSQELQADRVVPAANATKAPQASVESSLSLLFQAAELLFASVVSLIPGVFLFRMGGGLLALIAVGAKNPTGLLQDVIVDGATSFVVMLAMAFGLIIPKLCIDRFHHADAA
jgi:hypothetical protein